MATSEKVKTCSKCKQTLPAYYFPKKTTGKYGVGGVCKKCKRKHVLEYERKNRKRFLPRVKKRIERIKRANSLLSEEQIYDRTPTLRCGKCKNVLPSRKFYINRTRTNGINNSSCKKCAEELLIYKQYRVTIDDIKKIILEQGEKCAICNKKIKLHIDHNHKTGEVRGLLCPKCNQGIGLFEENINYLLKAVLYIKKWNEKSTTISS